MFNFNDKLICESMHNPCGTFPKDKPRYTMTEELEHTAQQMRETINRLLRFEERLKADYEDIKISTTNDNTLFKSVMRESWATFIESVKNEINDFESNVDNTIALFQKDIESNYGIFTEEIKSRVKAYALEVEQKAEAFETENLRLFKEFKAEASARIDSAETYMKDNLSLSVDNLLKDMDENGEIDGILESNFIISVKKHGAQGDGSTINTAMIQAALTAAGNKGGGIVYIPVGTYLTNTLSIPSNVTLLLADGATLKLTNSSGCIIKNSGGGVMPNTNIKIIGGTIDCNKSVNYTTNESGGGIYMSMVDGLTIDTKITNCSREGFYLTDCENVVIKIKYTSGGTATGSYYGYGGTLLGCENATIKDSTFKDIYGYGVHVQNSKYVDVSNCTFDTIAHGENGIGVTVTNSDFVTVKANRFNGCHGRAIECNYSRDCVFEANIIRDCSNGYTFGDNETGNNNERITVSNDVQSGITAYGYSLNYLAGAKLDNCNSNKSYTTTYSIASNDVRISNCKFGSNSAAANLFSRFILSNVDFADVHFDYNAKHKTAFTLPAQTIATNGNAIFRPVVADDYFGAGSVKIVLANVSNTAQKKVITAPVVLSTNNITLGEQSTIYNGYDFPVTVSTSGSMIVVTNKATVQLFISVEIL